MIFPNLFVPGAAKSATSSLHDYLGQHPQIFMCKIKEPHYFSNDASINCDSASRLSEYTSLFADGQGYPIRGESSTGYMIFPHVAERIKKTIPDPRFIFIFRNPIDRAYSHYWWLRGRGHETRAFRDAVLADMYELPNPENRITGLGGYRYYFAFGQYGKYLQPFITAFGRASVLIIITEQMRSSLLATLNLCFEFLRVATLKEVLPIRANETIVYGHAWLYRIASTISSQVGFSRFLKRKFTAEGYTNLYQIAGRVLKRQSHYPAISTSDRRWLGALYRDEVQELREMTGLTFDEWASDYP